MRANLANNRLPTVFPCMSPRRKRSEMVFSNQRGQRKKDAQPKPSALLSATKFCPRAALSAQTVCRFKAQGALLFVPAS